MDTETKSLMEAVGFQIVGLILVFTSLGLIALVLYGMGYFLKRDRKPTITAGIIPAKKPREKPAIFPHEEDQEALLMVITTAVDEVIKEPHRILSVRRMVTARVSGDISLQAWSAEGRRQQFASHVIR